VAYGALEWFGHWVSLLIRVHWAHSDSNRDNRILMRDVLYQFSYRPGKISILLLWQSSCQVASSNRLWFFDFFQCLALCGDIAESTSLV
jgi:hypothetical protein